MENNDPEEPNADAVLKLAKAKCQECPENNRQGQGRAEMWQHWRSIWFSGLQTLGHSQRADSDQGHTITPEPGAKPVFDLNGWMKLGGWLEGEREIAVLQSKPNECICDKNEGSGC